MEDIDNQDAIAQKTPLSQRAREHLSKVSRPLKIAAAASIGFMSGSSAGRYVGEPMLYPRIPGIEPIEVVRASESEFNMASPCYQIVDSQLERQSFDLLPTGSNKILCFSREDIEVPEGEFGGAMRFITDDEKEISVPKELSERLWNEIKPLKDLSPDPKRIKGIKIAGFVVEGYGYRYDDPSDTPSSASGEAIDEEGIVLMKLNEGVPVSERDMELLVFHEAAHLAEGGDIRNDAVFTEMFQAMQRRGTKNEKTFYAYRDSLPDDIRAKFTEGDFMNDHFPALGSLFTLVDESTYMTDGSTGHPKTNKRELFASTAVVLRYFPSSFMASVNKLNPEDQQFMKSLAGHIVKFFNGSSDEIDQERLQTLFAPELLRYLFEGD